MASDILALANVDHILATRVLQCSQTDRVQSLDLAVSLSSLFDQAHALSELEIGGGLVRGGDPAIADQQSLQGPFRLSFFLGGGVARLDSGSDVGDMHAGVRFTGEVEL